MRNMKLQIDPILLDLSRSILPQETCELRPKTRLSNMGFLVLLVLTLFLIPSKITIWPSLIFQILFIFFPSKFKTPKLKYKSR